MSEITFQHEWRRMRQAVPFYIVVQLTLLAIALVELPTLLYLYQQQGIISMDGWIGLWAVLEIFGLSIGLILLVSRYWRQLALKERINPIFGFFLGSWIGMVAFLFHIPTKTSVSFLTAGLGIAMLVAFLVVRRGFGKPEEIFP